MILNNNIKDQIIERLDKARKNRGFSYEKVGQLFGITQGGASNAFRRKSLNEQKINILIKELHVNEQWLLTGEGEMFTSNYGIAKSNTNTVEEHNAQYGVKGVPFYDVEFKAGFDLAAIDIKTNPEYLIHDPIYAGCDAVIPAFGNSMIPKIFSGDRLGIKYTNIDDVLYGETYALLTDDWRTIKYVRKSKDDTKVRLVPENLEDFDEQEIDKKKIKQIFLVKVVSRENC